MIVLAGDLGGTHTRLALARVEGQRVVLERVTRHRNAEHAGLDAILAAFLNDAPACDACCLAVAGPTDGRHVRFTNLAWQIDAVELAKRFAFATAVLVNDFAAVGWGLAALAPHDLHVLQDGRPVAAAARIAVGAGTGLGVALCTWDGSQRHYRPQASEGGHIGFAPLDPEQDALLGFLRELHGRVSVERILSGPGLVDLYRFCLRQSGRQPAAPWDAAAISAAGLGGEDAEAVRALRLFATLYGQTAGDIALLARAEGGVFLAGGIAPKLLPILQEGGFLAGFHGKGRFSDWMRSLPVAVILDLDIGLRGAAIAGAASLLANA